jgi:hypothetical protein
MTSLVVRMRRSALPFWGDVCGHERQKQTARVAKKSRRVDERNSPPLSHCKHLIVA